MIYFGCFILIIFNFLFPDDPNFIFSENKRNKKFLGFKGSLVSDFFFPSNWFGIFFNLFTIKITGINILLNKKIIVFFENFFFIVLYSVVGLLFFYQFFKKLIFL